MAQSPEGQLDPVVDQAFPREACADLCFAQEIDRALLEHAGANPLLDVGPAMFLEDDGLDALEMQQL